jgi:hypothetical protein
MYACIHVYMYTCMYVCVCVCVCMYLKIANITCTINSTKACGMNVTSYCMHVCMVCMHVCMYVYVYISRSRTSLALKIQPYMFDVDMHTCKCNIHHPFTLTAAVNFYYASAHKQCSELYMFKVDMSMNHTWFSHITRHIYIYPYIYAYIYAYICIHTHTHWQPLSIFTTPPHTSKTKTLSLKLGPTVRSKWALHENQEGSPGQKFDHFSNISRWKGQICTGGLSCESPSKETTELKMTVIVVDLLDTKHCIPYEQGRHAYLSLMADTYGKISDDFVRSMMSLHLHGGPFCFDKLLSFRAFICRSFTSSSGRQRCTARLFIFSLSCADRSSISKGRCHALCSGCCRQRSPYLCTISYEHKWT